MKIANPIYDVFFKYLMEDTEIAKGLLSEIISEEITELIIRPQEESTRSAKFDIIIFRLDFKAIIKTRKGSFKKILIELQKSKDPADILRFRRYLGENYQKEDSYIDGGKQRKDSLPIVTIYFLGFPLEYVSTSALKVNREYLDLISGKRLDTKEAFIEKLTHDSYVIQIRRLSESVQTELERVLTIFNQTYVTDDRKLLELNDEMIGGSELLQLMVTRLGKAATNEEILKKARLEEEVEERIEQHIREKQELAEENDELKGENDGLKDENDELKKELERLREQLNKDKKTE